MEMLRTEHSSVQYAIAKPKNGRLVYIGRRHYFKRGVEYGCTVKINEAMLFDKPDTARKHMEKYDIDGMVCKVKRTTELLEVM